MWRRHRGRLVAAVAAAAAIVIAAIVVPLSLTGGPVTPVQATVVIPLHATAAAKVFGTGAATARATARQAGESWTFDLTVHGLKPLPGNDVYECWWAGPGSTPGRELLVTGGSFVVGKSGSATLTMTTGADPRQFRTMEITAESPGNGALHGPVLLTGQNTRNRRSALRWWPPADSWWSAAAAGAIPASCPPRAVGSAGTSPPYPATTRPARRTLPTNASAVWPNVGAGVNARTRLHE